MIYGSICSGIEAATVAWEPLNFRPAWFAEIDPFCSAVLAHHYPDVTNRGDFTRIQPDGTAIDILVGGTPCPSFSVAGRRGGLDDPRGKLALEFCLLAGRLRPRWIVWENVPGVLSSNRGRDFGAILGALAKLGYGCAWRVLDAQFFGVPQRRRRVFVVGHLGDWRRAAAVLFERQGMPGHAAPRKETRQDIAGSIGGGSGARGWCSDTDRMTFVPAFAFGGNNTAGPIDIATACNAKGGAGRMDFESETFVAEVTAPLTRNPYADHDSRESLLVIHTLRANGFDASEDGAGRGTPLVTVPLAFSCKDYGAAADCIAPTLRAMSHAESHANAGGQVAVVFEPRFARNGRGAPASVASPLKAESGRTGKGDGAPCVATASAVRRLTPREAEALQGFEPDYTLTPGVRKKQRETDKDRETEEAFELRLCLADTIDNQGLTIPAPVRWIGSASDLLAYHHRTERGRAAVEMRRGRVYATADGPHYRAIGNSMAVPVMRWIGRRIQIVDGLE